MKEFITYLFHSGICISFFALIYFVFLKKLTCFRFNRVFLLLGLIISFILPMMELTYDVEVPPITIPVMTEIVEAETIDQVIATEETSYSIDLWTILFSLYLLGAIIVVIRNISIISRMQKLKKEGTCIRAKGHSIVEHAEIKTPFTILNCIFINPDRLQKREKDIILKHEISHIEQKHWLDLLCGEGALMLQWFNPLVWFYIHLMKENHEYLADQAVLSGGESDAAYRAVLINQQFQGPVFSFANSFSYSTNKNRFSMMEKSKTKPWKKLTALAILPLIGIFLTLSAKPNYVVVEDDSGGMIVSDQPFQITEDSVLIIKAPKLKNSKRKWASQATIESLIEQQHSESSKNKLIILEGKEISYNDFKEISFTTLDTIFTLESDEAKIRYGEKGKNGAIIIKIADHVINFHTDQDGKIDILDATTRKYGRRNYKGILTKPFDELTKEDNSKRMVILDGKEISFENFTKLDIEKLYQIEVYEYNDAINKFGERGKEGVIVVTSKKDNPKNIEKKYNTKNGDTAIIKQNAERDKSKLISPKDSLKLTTVIDYYTEGSKPEERRKVVYQIGATNIHSQPLIILDGKEMGQEALKNTDPKTIKSISILKDTAAVRLYGEKAKDGLIIINLKKNDIEEQDIHLRLEGESIQINEHPEKINLEFQFDEDGSPKVVDPKETTSYQTVSKGNVKRLFDNIIKDKENSKSLVMINDKETSYEAFSKLNPEDFEQIGFYKGDAATKLFGEKGKDGVILAKSK